MIYVLAPLLLITLLTRSINNKKLKQKYTLREQEAINHIFYQMTNSIDLENEDEEEKNV